MKNKARKGYFFLEALVCMMIVSVVLGGTMNLLSNASSVSQGNKRQLTALFLCEEVMENLRQQWISAIDPVAEIVVPIDVDEQLPEPLNSLGWRNTKVRCPWPTALSNLYSGQYKLQPLFADNFGELKRLRSGTLFQLQVRILSNTQDETVSLVTFLPVAKVPCDE